MRQKIMACLLVCTLMLMMFVPAAAVGGTTSPEEPVEFIVELTGDPLLGNDDVTRRAELEARQDRLLDAIASLDGCGKVTLVQRYTAALNAVAVKAPYTMAGAIEQLDGVARVSQSAVFTTAEEPVSQQTFHYWGVDDSGDMMELEQAHDMGLDGKGVLIAMIDTGIDTDHPAFSAEGMDLESVRLTLDDIKTKFRRLNANVRGARISAEDVYLSAKIPFAFNYAESTADVDHELGGAGDHGTTVSAIAAGVKTPECDPGAAPGAQLLVMKVFRNGSNTAYESVILAAIEDAVALGADVINLSLGVVSGFSSGAMAYSAALQNAARAGIVICAAAGNEHSSTYANNSGKHLGSTADIDVGIISEPSTLSEIISVASIENALFYASGMCYDLNGKSKPVTFNDTGSLYGLRDFMDLAGTEGHEDNVFEYVVVPGIGTEEDYDKVDVKGRVALVQRGEITFVEKSESAFARGALAVVVYNNVDEDINMDMTNISEENDIPCVIISRVDGEAMVAAAGEDGIGSLTILFGNFPIESPSAWQASGFSSWGPLSDLSLKPDLATVGGDVRAAADGGTYATKSGTSMAAPQASGISAILLQYVHERYGLSGTAARDRVQTLLMNTARPIMQEDGVEYSPRKQGAGLVSAAGAVVTPVRVTVNGSALPKAELGDDRMEHGTYSFTFTAHNDSASAVRYILRASMLTETAEDGWMLQKARVLDYETEFTGNCVGALCELDENGEIVYYDVDCDGRLTMMDMLLLNRAVEQAENGLGGDQTLTVPAGGEARVKVTVRLTDAERERLSETFENGIYIEGYVYLEAMSYFVPELSIPVLAFYGDWSKAPLFCRVSKAEMESEAGEDMTGGNSPVGYSVLTGWMDHLGSNPVGTDKVYIPSRSNALGTGHGSGTSISGIQLDLLRNAKTIKAQVLWNGKILYETSTEQVVKSNYSSGTAWAGWNSYIGFDFDPHNYGLGSGSKFIIRIIGEKDATGRYSTDTMEIPVYIDGRAPEFKSVTVEVGADGRTYLKVSARDDQYISGFEIFTGERIRQLQSYVADQRTSGETVTMMLDVTDFIEDANGKFKVAVYDYASNMSFYEIEIPVEEMPSEEIPSDEISG